MNAFLNNDDFDSRLKNLAVGAETDLPEGSWERLQLKKEKQNNKRKTRLWMYFSLSAVLLLVLAFVFSYHTTMLKNNSLTSSEQNKSKNVSVPSNDKANPGEKENTSSEKIQPGQESVQNITTFQNEKPNYTVDQTRPKINEENITQKPVQEYSSFSKNEDHTIIDYHSDEFSEMTFIERTADKQKDSLPAADVKIKKDTAVIINSLLTQDLSTPEQGNKKLLGNEIHIGLTYGLNLPWILNQNTYGEFGGKELAYKFDFGSAYSITVGYDVQRRFGFQTGIIIHSRQGQKYHDTFSLYGTVDREITLDYYHIPLLLKLKRPLGNKTNPVMLNIVAGLQYGHLKKATETLNNVSTDITERFNRNEIGFIFNIESDIYLSNSLYFTFGLNSSIGNNINQKDWEQYVSHSKGRSYNMVAGATFGLSYYFPVK